MSEIYEGNSITVNNINKSKAKIKIRGGSWQETRSGKNKFYGKFTPQVKEGISLIVNSDDTILINGTNNLGDLVYTSSTFSLKAGTYIASGMPDGTSIYDVYIQFSYFENEKKQYVTANGNKFTLLEDKDNVVCYIGFKQGKTANNIILKPMLREATIEDDTYEQYGVSPSPEFPSEIKNVTGEINKYYIPNSGKITSNGITATYTGNTSEIILDGVATRDFSDGFEIKNILLKKGTYSVSVWGLNKINEEYDRFFVADTSNNNKVIVNYVQSYRTQKFTLEQDTNIKLSFIIKAGSTYSNTKVKIMINEGDIGLSYVPYNSFKIRQTGKNILPDNRDDYNGSTYGYIKLLNNFENNNLVLSIEDNDKSIDMTGINFGVTGNGKNWDDLGIWLLYNGNKIRNSISTNQYSFFSFYPNNQTTFDKIFKRYKIQAEISKDTVPTEWEKYKFNSWIFPFEEGQKLYEGSYLAKDGIHNVVNETTINILEIITLSQSKNVAGVLYLKNKRKTIEDRPYGLCTKAKLSSSQEENTILENPSNFLIIGNKDDTLDTIKEKFNGATIQYKLDKEEIIPYTPEQQNAFYQLQNIILYDGINHISTDNELGSMSVEVSKIIEDYETYISSNGFFINSQNDIHYLIDFSESELPCMAEATETTVKAAGRNGDIVLSTTYDPNNFNIVCYTEDNLTQEEKVKEEMKLKKLLNSIKNKTIPLAFEKDDKFYKVKYSGAFSSTNFPKHLKFSIPLKTSESYGKDLIKKVIFGNGEEISDTFEDVGAIFTIKGPANSPIISLNDYSIEYDNPLLEGDKLIINSSNSTITHINSDGVKTNAMRYYNHQFPKIENGKNVLKVLSGVNEANVSVEWYDYKF